MKTTATGIIAGAALSLIVIMPGKAQEKKEVHKAIIKTVEMKDGQKQVIVHEFNPNDPKDKQKMDSIMATIHLEGGKDSTVKVRKMVFMGDDKEIHKLENSDAMMEFDSKDGTTVKEEDIIMPDGKKGKKIVVTSIGHDGDKLNKEHQEIRMIGKDGQTMQVNVEVPDGASWKDFDGNVETNIEKGPNGEVRTFIFKQAKEGAKPIIIRISEAGEMAERAVSKSAPTKEKLDLGSLKVYPNPNSGKFNLDFQLDGKGKTEVSVTDISGKVVFSEVIENFSGAYHKELDLSSTPSGSYFVSVMQNGKRVVKQVVLGTEK